MRLKVRSLVGLLPLCASTVFDTVCASPVAAATLSATDLWGAGLAALAEPLPTLSAIAQDAMLAARPEYLLASLRAIEARYGSVRRYLLDELALEPALLERLHERLLT